MLHFQVSPPKKPVKVTETEKIILPTYLVLGTFTAVPKIHFDRVSLGQSKSRTLIVRNPTSHNVYFRIMKKPNKGFTLSCELENNIPSEDQLLVEITWKPEEVGSCFYALSCQSDLSGIKLSVHLIGECTPPPVPKKGFKLIRPLVKIPNPSPSPSLRQDRNSLEITPNPVFKYPEPCKTKEINIGNSQDQVLRRETFNVDKENSPQLEAASYVEPKTPPSASTMMSILSSNFQFTPDASQSSIKQQWNRGMSRLEIEAVEETDESGHSDSGSRRGTYVLDETDDEIQRTLEAIDRVLHDCVEVREKLTKISF